MVAIEIRHAEPDDYPPIIARLNDWWGGRQMADMLPRLFFTHFRPTSFVAVDDGDYAGFIAAFVSHTDPGQVYVHFIGVNPAQRGGGVGRLLYERVFEAARVAGCREVRCITSPVNRASIAFHQRMGFAVLPGPADSDGVPYTPDYDGPGNDAVRFRFDLASEGPRPGSDTNTSTAGLAVIAAAVRALHEPERQVADREFELFRG